ncbi:MAG TPA: NTP transferase domain-containing protein [Armatimonadota bacterium]|nr:NTP transferase domain-containing protein [Armatimonadota bacterium]
MDDPTSDITAVILAAGHGKRMLPVTQWLPKPLVPVDGTPILVRNIGVLRQGGIKRAVVVYGSGCQALPDALDSFMIAGMELEYALQKEQRGTGDAILAALPAVGTASHILIMAGDVAYESLHMDAVLERFREGDVDGCVLLKERPLRDLPKGSVAVLDDDGLLREMVPKPSPGVARRLGSRLVDASLQIVRTDVAEHLRRAPLSEPGELEMSTGLTAWIDSGARVAGVVRPTPRHVTDIQDFVVNSVPWARPLVSVSEIKAAVLGRTDVDLSEHVDHLKPSDVAFVYRQLKRLEGETVGANMQARVKAIASEMFRRQLMAQADPHEPDPGDAAGDLPPDEAVATIEPRLLDGDVSSDVLHGMAVAMARQANTIIGEAVFQESAAVTPASSEPVPFLDRVAVRTPARLAFSSSQGSDISYIIQEKQAVVLNCAVLVDGRWPGRITIERLDRPCIELASDRIGASERITDLGDILGHVPRSDHLVLLKAALRFSGLLDVEPPGGLQQWCDERGGGLRIALESRTQIGSGLGSSAILAAGLIKGLREIGGLVTNDAELLRRSYCCERFYGRSGYQDIIGGASGGVKLIQADATTGLFSPRIRHIELDEARLASIGENVLVFHTGEVHVANPYMLTIAAKYFLRSSDYMYAYETAQQLTHAMADCLEGGEWERLGELLGRYWDDRESFEPGVTPEPAATFRRELEPWTYGTALAGSGHGGYMIAVLKPGARGAVIDYLASQGIGVDQVLAFSPSEKGISVERE